MTPHETEEAASSNARSEPHKVGSPRTVRLLTAVLLLATFAAGTVMGAGVCRWVVPREERMPPPMLAPIPLEEFDLTQQQWEDIRIIVDRRRPELDAILQETYPKVRKITDEIDKEVRDVLTPEQKVRFDELKKRPPSPHRGGRPPGPPPSRGWMPPPPPRSGDVPPLPPPGSPPLPQPQPHED